ncbi:ABC transporter permease [Micromonospora sp. CPCC 206060]|uniref:ABC transporter permease n=1 Tax=Micromonospora sp. CPCC 206060 TaxID=3122406 RepID=UPI002FF31C85
MNGNILNTARLVVFGGIISYRALFNWASPSMFLGTLLCAPLVQMLFFVYLGRQLNVADDRFYVIGNAVLAASMSSLYGGTMAIANERRFGTLGAVLLSTRSRLALWLGRGLPYVLNGLIVASFTLTVGALLFGLDLSTRMVLLLIPVVLVAACSCTAFGLVLGAVGLRFRDVMLISNITFTLMLLLTGANVPRSVLPAWMVGVGDVLPLTHAAEAARLVTGAAPTDRVLGAIGAEALVGLCHTALAVLLLRYFEYASRRSGALDVM